MSATGSRRMFVFDAGETRGDSAPAHARAPAHTQAPTAEAGGSLALTGSKFLRLLGPAAEGAAAGMFLVRDGTLYEVRRISPLTPASWFVGDSVVSDGSVTVLTRFDPLYLLLPALLQCADRFVDASEVFSRVPLSPAAESVRVAMPELKGVPSALEAVCDVREELEGSRRLYRLNRDKLQAVLESRIRAAGAALQDSARKSRARLQSTLGNFAAASTAVMPPPSASPSSAAGTVAAGTDLTSRLERTHLETAAGVLGEYVLNETVITAALHAALRHEGYPVAVSTASSPVAAAPAASHHAAEEGVENCSETASSAAAAWNDAALTEVAGATGGVSVSKFVNIGRGGGGGSPSDGPGSASKKPSLASAPTLAQKKLASTNIKGMKALNSWFGGKT